MSQTPAQMLAEFHGRAAGVTRSSAHERWGGDPRA